MSNSKPFSEVLLLGSGPLASAKDFFTTTSSALSKRLHHVPDGETGSRGNFVACQHPNLPITIIQPRWGGQPSAESSAKEYTLEDIKPTGYDDHAIASYAIFCELKAAGTITSGTRFQVSLPTPLNVVRGFVEDDGVCAQVDPLYEQRLLQALHHLQEQIPASDLTIQWDLPTEVAVLEYERGGTYDKYWKPYFSPVKDCILQRLVQLAKAVGPDVEMGYHLCYGDFGHVHFVQPSDTSLLVELANAIVASVDPIHPVAYFQMPVPKDRTDETYFLPLKNLELHGAKLFLGVVHAHDESGTRKRLEAARSVYPQVAGVSTECGMGRTPREDLDSVLEICASVAEV
ncbi:hypothetical protein MMC28_006137 [Mycoblastus sanguinarius]|nr:hypothetical protein [Mycoblastus sanguinarius]